MEHSVNIRQEPPSLGTYAIATFQFMECTRNRLDLSALAASMYFIQLFSVREQGINVNSRQAHI